MKNTIFLFTLFLLLLTSCSIEKRYHSSGFHVAWHKPVTIKNLADKREKPVKTAPKLSCINAPVMHSIAVNTSSIKEVNSLVFTKPKLYSSKTSFKQVIKLEPQNRFKTIKPKKPKTDEPDEPRALEPFGLIAFILTLWPFALTFTVEEADNYILFMPLVLLVSAFFAGFSLGRIQSKPYLYYGAIFGILTLAALLFISVLFFLILLFGSIY